MIYLNRYLKKYYSIRCLKLKKYFNCTLVKYEYEEKMLNRLKVVILVESVLLVIIKHIIILKFNNTIIYLFG